MGVTPPQRRIRLFVALASRYRLLQWVVPYFCAMLNRRLRNDPDEPREVAGFAFLSDCT